MRSIAAASSPQPTAQPQRSQAAARLQSAKLQMDPTTFYARYQQYWAELSARLDAPGMSPLRVAERWRWGAEIEVAGVGTAAAAAAPAGDNAGPRLALVLLSAVVERGGCFAVSAHKRWAEVCQAVGLVREGRGHGDREKFRQNAAPAGKISKLQ
eukprot:SAG25_NODE_2234_length_1811_cov_2.057827_1_plen_154_part_10